jgi:hypothetical protein
LGVEISDLGESLKGSFEFEGKLGSIILANVQSFVDSCTQENKNLDDLGSISVLYILNSLKDILNNLGIRREELSTILASEGQKWWGSDLNQLTDKLTLLDTFSSLSLAEAEILGNILSQGLELLNSEKKDPSVDNLILYLSGDAV